VANPASFTRSAARATSSAYRRLSIRWRLAGGSAALTLVILCGFAVLVGTLTTRRLYDDFNSRVARASDDLARRIDLRYVISDDTLKVRCKCPSLTDYAAAENAAIRLVSQDGDKVLKAARGTGDLGPPNPDPKEVDGYRVETRYLPVRADALLGSGFDYRTGQVALQYARPISSVKATVARVRFFLVLGVLGGTLLALLAGLATARRAMSPIAQLTEAARTIARTRDPNVRLPRPEADDEVAELARTLEGMLEALAAARAETEGMLERQREFVADASHELRTPLTSVLANLELLEEELEGEQRDAAASALRSSRRMRRLVADLLLLARADAGRVAPHRRLDLANVLTEAAGELGPVAGEHELTIAAERGAVIDGARDELHRLVLNLLENALRHTDPGTAVRAAVERRDGEVVLTVEDEGLGIPAELTDKVFERFVRGGADRGGSAGLGLAIVRAVAESHGGTVELEAPEGSGARFVVRLPAADPEPSQALVPQRVAPGT